MNKKSVDKLKIQFVGHLDWAKLRDLLVLRMIESKSEEQFTHVLKMIMGSMFGSIDEINKTRKRLRLQLVSDVERKKFEEKNES